MELNELINNILTIKNNEEPRFGKMSAQHMVEHLILAIQISNGKLNVECFTPEEKLPTLKRILVSERPLPKGFINPLIGENLLELKYTSLDEAKSILKIEMEDYENYFNENPEAILVHPIFGKLNKSEWDIFHKKHFKHHLKQFGLI